MVGGNAIIVQPDAASRSGATVGDYYLGGVSGLN